MISIEIDPGTGHEEEPEFEAWLDMLGKCYDPEHPDYPDEGGRGITVCDRWRSYEDFLADMRSYEDFLADMGPMLKPENN